MLPSSPASLDEPLRVVGIGASAGGLAPLTAFVAQLRPGSGLAYVVVQHLHPSHGSMLRALLQLATPLPVVEATDGVPLRTDCVYVITPNTELRIEGGRLRVCAPSQARGLRLPVDMLLMSLAQDFGARAVGVILSGMGADGAQGFRAIQAKGGMTLAQQPQTAEFDAMPLHAMATSEAVVVGLPASLPGLILAGQGSAHCPANRAPGEAGTGAMQEEESAADGCVEPRNGLDEGVAGDATEDDPNALAGILALLKARSGHDLSAYKVSTLMRRVARRKAMHQLPLLAAYRHFLEHNPQELDLLFKEMLIGVTSFFRDGAVWQQLREEVLPALLARCAERGRGLRAWVVGCSSGEEAYSLAMLLEEAQAARPELPRCEVQIFATDLSADAIAMARKGHYRASIEQELSPQRLARFFRPRANGYEVDASLRERLLFAQHNVIQDPPFTRLDILCCRNVMIYFDSALQSRLLPLFHYSLLPGGLLFLGRAETAGRSEALFTPLRPHSWLYWRTSGPAPERILFFPIRNRISAPVTQEHAILNSPLPLPANLQSLADQLLLHEFVPASVLVNPGGDILYIQGRTGRYLEPAAGKANWNIHVMVRPGLRTALALALRQAAADADAAPLELKDLPLEEGAAERVDITVRAVREPPGLKGTVLVVLRPAAAPAPRRTRRKAGPDAEGQRAAADMARALEEIRTLREEVRASKEEMQAAVEELQSTNEELQSSNEELTTSKEEAQSMNEELQTINGELQRRLSDLALAQSDLQNLLNSTDIATLFLDVDLHVRRFTAQIGRVFHLRDADIGRPLSELASQLIYPELHADVAHTLRTLTTSEKSVPTMDGRWFSVRMLPYRTLANVIDGLVLTFVDTTVAKQLEQRLALNRTEQDRSAG